MQDAYSRAWRDWARVGPSPDPTGWVRTVAIRSTIRPWLERLARFGSANQRPPSTRGSTRGRPGSWARCASLRHRSAAASLCITWIGLSRVKIAAVERVPMSTIHARLGRGRWAVLAAVGEPSTGQAEDEE